MEHDQRRILWVSRFGVGDVHPAPPVGVLFAVEGRREVGRGRLEVAVDSSQRAATENGSGEELAKRHGSDWAGT